MTDNKIRAVTRKSTALILPYPFQAVPKCDVNIPVTANVDAIATGISAKECSDIWMSFIQTAQQFTEMKWGVENYVDDLLSS